MVLRQKPHPQFKRVAGGASSSSGSGSGSTGKDLELFAGALQPGELLFAVEVPTIGGGKRLLAGSAFR